MLFNRLRRWPSIKTTMGHRLVLAGGGVMWCSASMEVCMGIYFILFLFNFNILFLSADACCVQANLISLQDTQAYVHLHLSHEMTSPQLHIDFFSEGTDKHKNMHIQKSDYSIFYIYISIINISNPLSIARLSWGRYIHINIGLHINYRFTYMINYNYIKQFYFTHICVK